jgi:hypothetical protein
MQNLDHNIGFREKCQFFRRKLSKMAENCVHNIDPLSHCILGPVCFYSIITVPMQINK